MLKFYHADPTSNSLKVLLCLTEKGLDFVSHPVDVQAFEQHEPWFIAINPDGQVPVLVHDEEVVTESTVINEYLDQVFPEVPLRPADALSCARMRVFTKFIDEAFWPALSQTQWQQGIHTITDQLSKDEFAAKLARIPLEEKRERWRIAAARGYSADQVATWRRTLERGLQKMERSLERFEWLSGDAFSLADVACFSMTAFMPRRFEDLMNDAACPRVMTWHARMHVRPGVKAALAMPRRTRSA